MRRNEDPARTDAVAVIVGKDGGGWLFPEREEAEEYLKILRSDYGNPKLGRIVPLYRWCPNGRDEAREWIRRFP